MHLNFKNHKSEDKNVDLAMDLPHKIQRIELHVSSSTLGCLDSPCEEFTYIYSSNMDQPSIQI